MSGFKIERLYAFIATDPEDGDEGVMAFSTQDGLMLPMIGADMDRVDQLRSIADGISKATGVDQQIKYFELEQLIAPWTCPDCGLVYEDNSEGCGDPNCYKRDQ